jgi:proteasome lid subunit RPN8/RPN11
MLTLAPEVLAEIRAHGEQAYPEEGAGFLLGTDGQSRQVLRVLALPNAREDGARNNRYLIAPQDYLTGEREADRLRMTLLGVFHSHPDHPDRPSEYDREWAQPNFSYIITSVAEGRAGSSRSWRLLEDRSAFVEEPLEVAPNRGAPGRPLTRQLARRARNLRSGRALRGDRPGSPKE